MLLLIVLQTVFLQLTSSMCPQPTLWSTAAARKCPTPSHYHCLMNEIGNTYEEFCFTPEKYPSGSYVIYDGGLTSKVCPSDRYQPKAFYSSEFYECVYSKSLCNNEGQLIHKDGTKETDRSCRCDYTKGYDYLTIPENLCYCFPDKEDCSCYLKSCPNGTARLTPDYECSQSGSLISCPFIKSSSTTASVAVNTPHREPKYDNKYFNVLLLKDKTGLYITSIIVVTIVFGISSILYLSLRYKAMRLLNSNEVSATVEIRRVAKDPFFVVPSLFDDLLQTIKQKPVLILKGREGTGKTTLALRLASTFLKEGYTCVLLNCSDLSKGILYPPRTKSLIIIDNPLGYSTDHESLSRLKKQLSIVLKHIGKTKLILTTNTLQSDIPDILNLEHIEINDIMRDIFYNEEDKLNILTTYRKKYEIGDILDKNMDDEIMNIEPVWGFPTTCVMFCSNIKNHNIIGVEYFKQPPPSIVSQINELRENGKSDLSKRNKYIVLAYVMTAPECKLDVHNINSKQWKKIQEQLFGIKTDIIQQHVIDAANRLVPQFLSCNEKSEFCFCHEAISKAVLMSYGSVANVDIATCDIRHLIALLTRNLYDPLYGQPFLSNITKNEREQQKLIQNFKLDVFKDGACAMWFGIIMNNCVIAHKNAKILTVVLETIQIFAKEKPELSKSVVLFVRGLMDLPDEYLFCGPKTDEFAYVWRYVSVKVFSNDQRLREIANREIDTRAFNTVVDNYGNTLLHYFVLWDSKHEQAILRKLQFMLSQNTSKNKKFLVRFNGLFGNKNNISALYLAAYLGKVDMFVTLERIIKLKEDFGEISEEQKTFKLFCTNLRYLTEQGKRQALKPLQEDDEMIKVDWYFLPDKVLFGTIDNFIRISDEIDPKEIKEEAQNTSPASVDLSE